MRLKQRIIITILICAILSFGSYTFATDSQEQSSDSYTVSFNLNGVAADAINPCTVESGKLLTLPAISGLSPESPEFLGWSTKADNTETLYQPGDAISIVEDTVLYAIWKQVTVTYVYGDVTETETILQNSCPKAVPVVTDTEQMTFTGWFDEKGQFVDPAVCPVAEDVTYTARFAVKFNDKEHSVYITGYEDGTFHPNGSTTRAEAAKMLYGLLLPVEITPSANFSDVPDDAWYAEPVNTLATIGVFNGYGDGTFLPQNEMTRAEFVTMLAKLFYVKQAETQTFTDVSKDNWAYHYIEYAVAQKWINGYGDGTFLPNGKITRAEAVTILNRVTGRLGNTRSSVSGTLRTFHDVPETFWGYAAIMEACTAHTHTITEGTELWTSYEQKRAAGLYQEGYELRYTDEDGWDARNTTIGSFQFDDKGNYTSGNAEIDRYCKEVLAKITTTDIDAGGTAESIISLHSR